MSAHPGQRRGPEPADADEAAEVLAKAFANGPRKAKELTKEAREAHGISKRTLDRAGKPEGGRVS